MGYIKEPKGIDLVVGPSELTEQDRKMISEIIANYKRTGRMPTTSKRADSHRRTTTATRRKVVA